jgi:integrase
MIALANIEPQHKYGASKNPKHQGKKQCLGWTNACQKALKEIDLHWHDLRHEGACRLLRSGVSIRTIQLMLGHTTLQQTQKYLNVTDEELKRDMKMHWEGRREKLRLLQGGKTEATA